MQRFTIRITLLAVGALAIVAGAQRHASAVIAHRWTFDDAAGALADGATLADSVGTADATVRGTGIESTGTSVTLPGGPSATAPFLDLPNGMISQNFTDITVEAWYTITGEQSWARVFDFGSTTEGEHMAPGGGGTGDDSFFLSISRGTNIGQQRISFDNNDEMTLHPSMDNGPDPVDNGGVDPEFEHELNEMYHVIVTLEEDFNEDGETIHQVYINGGLTPGGSTAVHGNKLSYLNDENNWFGRSNWTADANFEGEFHEIRIHDNTFTPGLVYASSRTGPETLPSGGEMSLEVNNTGGGDVTLINGFDFDVDLEYWIVESEDGQLIAGNVQSIDGDLNTPGDEFELAGGSNENSVAELLLNGSLNITSSADFDLGNFYDESIAGNGMDGDLEFSYKLADVEALIQGAITYIDGGGNGGEGDGDQNGDGFYNIFDYTLIRDGLGDTTTQADYDDLLANFTGELAGSGAGAGGVGAVPEPASWQMVCLAMAMVLCLFARSDSLRTLSQQHA